MSNITPHGDGWTDSFQRMLRPASLGRRVSFIRSSCPLPGQLWTSLLSYYLLRDLSSGLSAGRRFVPMELDNLVGVLVYELPYYHPAPLCEETGANEERAGGEEGHQSLLKAIFGGRGHPGMGLSDVIQLVKARVVYLPPGAATSFSIGHVMHAYLNSSTSEPRLVSHGLLIDKPTPNIHPLSSISGETHVIPSADLILDDQRDVLETAKVSRQPPNGKENQDADSSDVELPSSACLTAVSSQNTLIANTSTEGSEEQQSKNFFAPASPGTFIADVSLINSRFQALSAALEELSRLPHTSTNDKISLSTNIIHPEDLSFTPTKTNPSESTQCHSPHSDTYSTPPRELASSEDGEPSAVAASRSGGLPLSTRDLASFGFDPAPDVFFPIQDVIDLELENKPPHSVSDHTTYLKPPAGKRIPLATLYVSPTALLFMSDGGGLICSDSSISTMDTLGPITPPRSINMALVTSKSKHSFEVYRDTFGSPRDIDAVLPESITTADATTPPLADIEDKKGSNSTQQFHHLLKANRDVLPPRPEDCTTALGEHLERDLYSILLTGVNRREVTPPSNPVGESSGSASRWTTAAIPVYAVGRGRGRTTIGVRKPGRKIVTSSAHLKENANMVVKPKSKSKS
ncbi:hypothetical protein JAAARDRAFT_211308 [Jaapia argillacea MUCL 33604]|uniref:Uncharacterized protein n=1 Tax=Jaapia argillacea MUCL 33604 TaxID=933084 RepID=A0A067P8E4_9AGAM|nr:hypothetical protein JAAARDRAFT_211308 [Jaapia argillacea MUCL 33604]